MNKSERRFFDKVTVESILISLATGVATGWAFYILSQNKSLRNVVPPAYRSPNPSGGSTQVTSSGSGCQPIYVYINGGGPYVATNRTSS